MRSQFGPSMFGSFPWSVHITVRASVGMIVSWPAILTNALGGLNALSAVAMVVHPPSLVRQPRKPGPLPSQPNNWSPSGDGECCFR